MPKSSKVAKVGIKKEEGFLYFVDKDGDISKVKMNRGGKKKTKKATAKKKTGKKVSLKKVVSSLKKTAKKVSKRKK